MSGLGADFDSKVDSPRAGATNSITHFDHIGTRRREHGDFFTMQGHNAPRDDAVSNDMSTVLVLNPTASHELRGQSRKVTERETKEEGKEEDNFQAI